MLFPFLMTVVLPNSVIRNWPAWLGIYGFMTADRWLLGHWPSTGRALEYLRVTYGWSLLLVVIFAVLYYRYLDAKADNRLDSGIDPLWLTPKGPIERADNQHPGTDIPDTEISVATRRESPE
jgi:arabinofuranan 3-O-arabinosyltransferase